MRKLFYKSFTAAGADRLVWSFDRSRLRILCYHGICPDAIAGEPWMPHFFVTESRFEQQLNYLGRHANVLPLGEAVQRMAAGTLPPRSVAITFDDGYANNLHLALPLLKRYGMPASVFVSTSFVESGDFFPFLKLKLIRAAVGINPVQDYKSTPIDVVFRQAGERWEEVQATLTNDQRESLRPMTVDELRTLDPALIDIGGHTHSHCILANETDERRKQEIAGCLGKIAGWTGRPARTFSYPNGQIDDFGEVDKQILRSERIQVAVSGIAGANARHTDPLALRRYPVGLFHDGRSTFSAEVTGLRTALRSVSSGLNA